MKAKVGRKRRPVTVGVGGIRYPTVVKNGVRRFVENRLVKHLFDKDIVDLNRLHIDYANRCFSEREYAEFKMGIGYSLDGLAELSEFEELEMVTPEWTRKGRKYTDRR